MGAVGIAITAEQREDVERQLRRTDLTRRVRERLEMVKAAALGDEVERIARWSGRSVPTVEHWLARCAEGGVAALTDAKRSGPPHGGGCRLSDGHGGGAGDASARAGAELRRLDVRAGVGLSRAADGRAHLPRLVACALGTAWLGVWTTQANAQPPARPRCRRRFADRAAGAAGKRSGKTRSTTNCTSRTRRI